MSTRAYELIAQTCAESLGSKLCESSRAKKKLSEGQDSLRESPKKCRKNMAQKAFTTIAVPTRTPICARTCGISRVDRAAHVFCAHKCKSVMNDWPEMPSSSRREISGLQESGSQRALTKRNLIGPLEKCFFPLDVEMIDQLSTLEVLCPRAQWIMRRQFPQTKSITV